MATTMVPAQRVVVVGVDTHSEVHVAVALSELGERLSAISVPTTPGGFQRLLRWASSLGEVRAFGIEGPGSFGATLARHLKERGHDVLEVARPDRRIRREEGKSDTIDAEAAARTLLFRYGPRRTEVRRWVCRDDPIAPGGPPLGPEGEDPGREPAARPGHHLP